MKLLTTLFLTCPIKSCRSSPASFPLHFKECTLEKSDVDYNPLLLRNLLPRLDIDALAQITTELGLAGMMPSRAVLDKIVESSFKQQTNNEDDDDDVESESDSEIKGEGGDEEMRHPDDSNTASEVVGYTSNGSKQQDEKEEEEALQKLHTVLIQTSIDEGKLVCGNCAFEYPVKEGVGNFLLPGHLV